MTIFSNDAIGALEFTVRWEKDGIFHEERFLGRKFNPVNDIFPRGMREALEGKRAGDSISLTYEPRMCIPRFKESLVRTLSMERLRKKTLKGKPIIPMVGRFYPQGHINGLKDISPDTLTPFRLTALDENTFTADCNHPLANITVTFDVTIQYQEERDTGTYGSLTHWRESTCDWGPGMQTKLEGQPTDFFRPGFFDKGSSDKPQCAPPPLDAKAQENISSAYARFLNPDMRVLEIYPNTTPQPSGMYDAISFTHSMERLSDPVDTLKTLKEHLAPGGVVLVSFTNHFDANKVIQGWTELHEFERMGLILEYLRQAGLDTAAGTISNRNDWRNQDDPLFIATRGVSDPVYVVYGHKP